MKERWQCAAFFYLSAHWFFGREKPVDQHTDSIRDNKNFTGIMNKAQTFGHEEIKGAAGSFGNFMQGLFGQGDARPVLDQEYVTARPVPILPPVGNRNAAANIYTSNDTINITMPPIPGESAAEMARRTADELARRQEQKGRNLMSDKGAPR